MNYVLLFMRTYIVKYFLEKKDLKFGGQGFEPRKRFYQLHPTLRGV